MKTLKVKDCFDPKFNEYVVGPKKSGSRSAYLVYGEVDVGGKQKLAPGKGHEEILLVVSGKGVLVADGEESAVSEGEAVCLGPDFEGILRAGDGEALRYVSAGGHIPGGHDH